jgi:hypothetical protein
VIAHKSEDSGVDEETVVGGATSFSDLEKRRELGNNRTNHTTDNLID